MGRRHLLCWIPQKKLTWIKLHCLKWMALAVEGHRDCSFKCSHEINPEQRWQWLQWADNVKHSIRPRKFIAVPHKARLKWYVNENKKLDFLFKHTVVVLRWKGRKLSSNIQLMKTAIVIQCQWTHIHTHKRAFSQLWTNSELAASTVRCYDHEVIYERMLWYLWVATHILVF
jgi:hypothetical protein